MLPEGWFLKSVTHNGVDITDTGYDFKAGQRVSGIEIHLTRRVTGLSGTVQDARGDAVADYTIVAFSTNAGRWGYQTRFVRSARPDQSGTFMERPAPPSMRWTSSERWPRKTDATARPPFQLVTVVAFRIHLSYDLAIR